VPTALPGKSPGGPSIFASLDVGKTTAGRRRDTDDVVSNVLCMPGRYTCDRYAHPVQLGILFWFYRDVGVCENRLRMLRRSNPGVPIFGLYGGPLDEQQGYAQRLGALLDDFWAYPLEADPQWKWRHGDLVLSRWFAERGSSLEWDSVFVAQWDLVVTVPLRRLLPPLAPGDMLISGLRPVKEVESWWHWTRGEAREEYESFLASVSARHGAVQDPQCCQFIALVVPRSFLVQYGEIAEPEIGFLEYKVPVYAQVFGIPLVPDTCFRPWWPEDPATTGAGRTAALMHAWSSPVRLPVMLYEAHRPGGRRAFHPYQGIYPHDWASLSEWFGQTRRR